MFYQMIHNRALEIYSGPKVTAQNIAEFWFPAWMKAARDILVEFEAEGLENSAAEMRKIIDYSQSSIDRVTVG